MNLKFIAKATTDSEPLAAFQYRQWAVDWLEKYCATGVIVDLDVSIFPNSEKAHDDPFPEGHANRMRRNQEWSMLSNQVVGAETIFQPHPETTNIEPK